MEETKKSPFSSLPREKLEEQLIKNLKHIKLLRKENQELAVTAKDLEDKFNEQLQMNDDLQLRLQEQQQRPNISLGNIGKTLTSIIGQKKSELQFCGPVESITFESTLIGNDESPEVHLLKVELNNTKNNLEIAQQNEASIREFATSLQQRFEESQNNIEHANKVNKTLYAENNELKEQLAAISNASVDLNTKIEILKQQLKSKENEVMMMNIKMPDLQTTTSDLKQLMQKYNDVAEQYETLKADTVQLRISSQESERQTEQLRDALKKSMRSDKQKEEEIISLKSQVRDAEDSKNEVQQQYDGIKELLSVKDQEIKNLQNQIRDLQNKLETGKGSIEMENKVKRMQKMVEKSNKLYAEMQEKAMKSDERVRQLEILIHKQHTCGDPIFSVMTPKGNYIICTNGTCYEGIGNGTISSFKCIDSIQLSDKNVQTDKIVNDEENKNEYFEQLVVQYFRADKKTKSQLIPVILKFVNVPEEEIQEILGANNRYFPFMPF